MHCVQDYIKLVFIGLLRTGFVHFDAYLFMRNRTLLCPGSCSHSISDLLIPTRTTWEELASLFAKAPLCIFLNHLKMFSISQSSQDTLPRNCIKRQCHANEYSRVLVLNCTFHLVDTNDSSFCESSLPACHLVFITCD